MLVVEDEVRLAEAIARGLRAEGFDVDVAHTGPDGLWRALEGVYSAIVLDILLPGLNGYAVCRQLRAEGNRTPILMLTAKQGEHDEAEGLELGADDFLRKPFSFVVLVARLRALIRRTTNAPDGVLAVGDLRVDPQKRRCWRGPSEVVLTVASSTSWSRWRVARVARRRRPSCSPRCGGSTSTATTTSSRSTSAICARSSTGRSPATACRRCARSGTASSTTACWRT